MIADKNIKRTSLIHWKSKQIDRVCHSSKDTEKLTTSRLLDDATYEARKLETLKLVKHIEVRASDFRYL